jgi:NADH-quinone oxidoreductase subunit L
MGLGVGAYVAGFFHLVTHAAFKACLFLGSGSVIHQMHHAYGDDHDVDPQDMRNMGGLKDKMPITFWTFLLATVALSGFPLTSGFLSKDAILAGALGFGFYHEPKHILIPIMGFSAALLTAFYMFRLVFVTFFGKQSDDRLNHVHENHKAMTIPLIVLSSLSLWFFYSPSPIGEGWFYDLVQKPAQVAVLEHHAAAEAVAGADGVVYAAAGEHHDPAHQAHYPAMALSIILACSGTFYAFRTYFNKREEMMAYEAGLMERSWLFRALHNKWYFDEMYAASFLKGVMTLRTAFAWFDSWIVDGIVNLSAYFTRALAWLNGLFDSKIVDGLVNLVADTIIEAGGQLRRVQTGRLQTYVILLLAGIVVLMVARMIV